MSSTKNIHETHKIKDIQMMIDLNVQTGKHRMQIIPARFHK